MSRIGKETLEKQLPAILREQFDKDGLPKDSLPSWDYISANTRFTAQGLHNNTQDLFGQTLHEFLSEQGFGARSRGKWPTEDEKTIQSLQYFINSLEENKKLSDATINTAMSAINKVYEAIRNEQLDIEIVDLGHHTSEEERIQNIQNCITIIQYMDDDLDDSTMCNYPVYFSDYYDIVKNKLVFNQNPVEAALDEFDWYRSTSDPMPLTEEQLTDIWNTLDSLEHCPVQGYDLDNWCLWMKMLIVFLIAVGPRSNEVVNLDVETQMKFDDDPRVVFTQRKNLRRNEGPEEVPIMMGIEFLRAYQDYISMVDHNGKLVPSPESESGSRSANTLNNWLKRLCKKANVRLEDGTFPTMKNFRQTWTTLYKKTIHENREQIKFVSGEKGTKNHQVDEDHYLREVSNRRELRELGRKHFENLLNIESIPNLLAEKLDEQEYYERQTRFYDF